jgi:hypothetical protein
MGIEETEEKNHGFFVYHPDTNWYPAFRKLIRQNPLPQSFCAKSDNLDALVVYMQSLGEILVEEREDGKDIVFHLIRFRLLCVSGSFRKCHLTNKLLAKAKQHISHFSVVRES